jgi:hypothetical protein
MAKAGFPLSEIITGVFNPIVATKVKMFIKSIKEMTASGLLLLIALRSTHGLKK